MCGIAGVVSNQPKPRDLILQMMNQIQHRGPDGSGFESYFDSKVHLGHRRLSILDLSDLGRQPMTSSDRRYSITYNGEIYNYLELRKELIEKGYVFSSNTDTEVILAAYREWGERSLNRFNGMWAFAIVDRLEKTVFLARDRFGVKPLYYWISESGTFLFGSEIKQFTVDSNWNPKLNRAIALDFLLDGVLDHTDETLFQGVFQLKSGHCARIQLAELDQLCPGQRLNLRQWYLGSDSKSTRVDRLKSAGDHFYHLFRDSIRLRLRSDVPVGSCLSGGLDSSSIVSVINKDLIYEHPNLKQYTFSALSEIKEFDESEYIQAVVKGSGINDYSILPDSQELIDRIDELIWTQDEPFGSTSIFAQWKVFELAKKNQVTVMLDGQGADEQMAGYSGFFIHYLSGLIRSGQWLRFYREWRSILKLHGIKIKLRSILILNVPDFLRYRLLLKKFQGLYRFFNPQYFNLKSWSDRQDAFVSLRSALDASMKTHLPKLLHWEDRSSMAHGVEARVPFLDFRLVEFLKNLPENFLIRDGMTKQVLRQGMQGTLPETIRLRVSKLGFATAEEYWFRDLKRVEFRNLFQNSIQDIPLFADDLLKAYDEMLEGKRPFDFFYWRVLCFCRWIKIFKVQIE